MVIRDTILSNARTPRILLLALACTVLLASSTHWAGTSEGGTSADFVRRSPSGHMHVAASQPRRAPALRSSGSDPITPLPLVIDGDKTPDLIPDELAYRHFIAATAVAANATPNDLARREFMLTRAGLSKEERRVFVAAVTNVREDLDQLDQERRLNTRVALDRDALQGLKQRRNQVFADAHERLQCTLDKGTMARIDAHVREHVKKRIRIFGQAPLDSSDMP
jgi:hypothetical protein